LSKAAFPNAKSVDHLASAYIFHLTCGGFVECIFLWTVSHISNERHFLNGKNYVVTMHAVKACGRVVV
jgi:hypothetical protein